MLLTVEPNPPAPGVPRVPRSRGMLSRGQTLCSGHGACDRIIPAAPWPRRAREASPPSLEKHGRRKLGDAIDLLGSQELLRGLS
jgi:hypothetical protein